MLLFRSAKARERYFFFDDIISVNCYIITTLDNTEKCRIQCKSEAFIRILNYKLCAASTSALGHSKNVSFIIWSSSTLIFFSSLELHTHQKKFMIKLKINIKPIGTLLYF